MADEVPAGLDDFINQPAAPAAQAIAQAAPNAAAAAPTITQNAPVDPNGAPPGLNDFIAPELKEQQYGGAYNQAMTGLEGAASAATFGTSTLAEKYLLNQKDEDIQARRETNPYSYMAGQAAGLVGSSLILPGGGAAGALEGAGQLAGRAFENKIASAAVKSAVEASLFQGGDEVSKMIVNDPSQTLGSAAVNVGLSGVLGGALGAGLNIASQALGKVSPLWASRFGDKTGATLNDVVNDATNGINRGATSDAFREAVGPEPQVTPFDPMTGGQYGDHVTNALNEIKPNAYEIQEAGARNGLKLGGDALSDSDLIQKVRDSLSQRPNNVAGYHLNKEINNIYSTTQDMVKSALSDASNQTKFEAGEAIKSGILDKLNTESSAIQEGYNKLQPMLENIPVAQDLKTAASQAVLDNKYANIAPELKAQSETLAKQIQNVKSVDDAKLLRTYINNEIDKALPKIGAADTNRANLLLTAKQGLNNIREGALTAAENSTNIGDITPEAQAGVTSSNLQTLKDLDSQWAAHKEKLLELGNQAGLGKPSSTRTLANKLETISSEALTKKLLDSQDVNALRAIKEAFPEEFNIARRYKLKEIQDASTSTAKGRNRAIDTGSFLNQIKDSKMGPEARSLIFEGKSPQMLKDIDTLYTGALPPNFNPSGTASSISVAGLFSPSGVAENISDGLKYAMIKGIPALQEAMGGGATREATEIAAKMAIRSGQPINGPAFKSLVDYVGQTIKGETAISRATGSIFDAGKIVLPTVVLDKDSRKKLSDQITALSQNPEALMNVGGQTGHYAPDHQTAIASTSANAVNYLNSLKPQTTKQNPLDSEVKVNPVKQAEYDRALDIAQQPLLALSGIKSGRVTPHDLTTLNSVYPGLYKNLQAKLQQGIIESVNQGKPIPYQTRLGLSTFLGQPLDSTMTPQAIMANQPKPNMSPQQAQVPKGPGPHSYKALDKLPSSFQTPLQARETQRGGRS